MNALTFNEMNSIYGGNWKAWVDGACGAVGVWAAFGGPVTAPVGIFCAGWAIGRIL